MNLATELKAVTESMRQQAPAKVMMAMETAPAKLAASGLANKTLKRGSHMPDFELPDAAGKIVRSIDLRASAIAIESSTVTVAWVRELYDTCCAYGIAFIDAPVAGSRPQAEAAQLIYFVGGDATVVAQADPILKAMGSTVYHA